MDPNALQGLVNSVGRRIGQRPASDRAVERLRDLRAEEVDAFLRELDLPYAEPVVRAIETWLSEDWHARKHALVHAAETARVERMSPSS